MILSSSFLRYTIAITIMIAILSSCTIISSVRADGDEDTLNCAAKQYTGECCQPGATPFILDITECAPGFYCPWLNANDTMIVTCPPTQSCTLARLAQNFCPPQGKHEPQLCPSGKLCRTPLTMEPCPSGYYCTPGSFEPKPCGPLSTCPEGTEQRAYMGSLLVVALVDIAIIGLVILYRYQRKRERAAKLEAMRSPDEVSISHASGIVVSARLPRATRRLCKGFHHAKGEMKHMDFEFTNLSMKLPNDKVILTGVTGRVAPGKVTAIMGPSGAGKTTFLYTLTGKMDSSCVRGGELTINGQQAELSAFKKVVGYVPQDDVMMRELTVWDNIMHSARIRLPDWSSEQIEMHVRAVIESLGLVEVSTIKIGDETSRGISGGQRKRVNIGMELAAAPLALFLDEPTSGLDATAAMDVCNLLRDIAQETGITVAMVIHQPRVEIWNHLDDILLLAPGGKTVFQGPQSKAQRYFESHLAVEVHAHENPADVIMDAIAEHGEAFAKQWVTTGRDFLAKMADVTRASSGVDSKDKERMATTPVHNISSTHHGVAKDSSGVMDPPSASLSVDTINAGPVNAPTIAAPIDEEPRGTILHSSRHSPYASKTPNSGNGGGRISGSLVTVEMAGYGAANAAATATNGTSSNGHAHGLTPIQPPPAHRSINMLSNESQIAIVARELRGAPFWKQFLICHIRSLKQQHEKLEALFLESIVAMFAGFLMGVGGGSPHQGVLIVPYTILSPAPDPANVPQTCMFINMALGLAGSSPGVKAFGEERVVYWREAGAGHSRLAYFLGVSTASFYRIILNALHFTMVYHVLSAPRIGFGAMWGLVILTFFCIYGQAAALSMVLKRENAPLVAVVISLFAAVFGGYVKSLPLQLKQISYAYWASEAMYGKELLPFRGIYQVDEVDQPIFGYKLNDWPADMVIITAIGVIYRIVAYIAMVGCNRDKQR